ncbi:MAG: hypothetical protein P8X82_17745 [Gemmatimonadales bacterium]
MGSDRRPPIAIRWLADLVVIALGVLIALWVNNLNAERLEHRQEQAYLRGVLQDLGSDSAQLAYRSELADRGLHAADRLLELRRNLSSTPTADSLAVWLSHAAFVDNFTPQDHTYREILGAGGLTLIRDAELRRSISGYYRSIESAAFFTDWYKNEEEAYWDLLAVRLDPNDFEAVTRSEVAAGNLNVERVLAQLRTDNEIVNAILMNRHWTQLRLEITARRIAANQSLADTLRVTF